MNRNRLSTSNNVIEPSAYLNLDERILKLLSTPSNYEMQPDGKILIKCPATYLKGRGNISVLVFSDSAAESPLYKFNSIKECALFFNVSVNIINLRLNKGIFLEYKGQKLFF